MAKDEIKQNQPQETLAPETGIAKFFKLRENKTKLATEITAGAATFFTMVYIIFVNPDILSASGMPWGAVFLATIISAVIGTLIMGLFANVPYAQAPGMGLNAFFTFTVCIVFEFTWQAALAMVFICGVINIIITVTKIRKHLIKAIPKNLQAAIGAGIGLFIAFIGFNNAGLLNFNAGLPELNAFNQPGIIVTVIGLTITIILHAKKVKGSILIGIGISTVVAMLFSLIPVVGWENSVVNFNDVSFSLDAFTSPFKELGTTFGAAFYQGFPDLFSDLSLLPVALAVIFSFSLTDTFDTIGTFIGTGRRTGIFSAEDEYALENSTGFKSKMDRALIADAVATSIGAVFGTSNTTTYIESAAGIEAGGRTGLTSVVTAIFFILCIFIAPIARIVPFAATAPALIVIGILMMGSLKDLDWTNFEDAAPAFLTLLLMVISYNISIGIAFGFIFHVIIKMVVGKKEEIHPIMYVSAGLFVVYFILMAIITL